MSDIALLRIEGGKANSMTPQLLETIERMIDDFEKGAARAAVLTGYDKFFSAGLALPTLIDLDRATMKGFMEQFARVMLRVYRCEKPIVAAINGHAIAGGCVLAMMCDVRVISNNPDVRIGLNETQLGIGLPAVVLEPLRAQVNPAALVPIAVLGSLCSPDDAAALGLVNYVSEDVMSIARDVATRLAAVPPAAAANVKRALRAPVVERIERVGASDAEAWLDTWYSPDAQTRLRAAVAKMKK